MQSITFTCEVITPMFLNGADGQTPELRPPSIKGAMRFWWRALHGHLPLQDTKNDKGDVIKGLKSLEAEIFGGSGNNVTRSKILIRVSPPNRLQTYTAILVPHKEFMKAQAISPGQLFDVHLSITSKNAPIKLDELEALFELTCLLGGLGKRVRRGMGSINIINAVSIEPGFQNAYPVRVDLGRIHKLVSIFSPFYTLNNDSINFNYSGKSERYGFIKQIQLGRLQNERLLFTISNAAHKIKEKSGYAYDPSMGHAFKGRYASPVYVSTVQGFLQPIITTLNIAPDKNEHQASRLIQEDFKKLIL